VNLQKTPYNNKASLLLHHRTDKVIGMLMEELGLPIPVYESDQDTIINNNNNNLT